MQAVYTSAVLYSIIIILPRLELRCKLFANAIRKKMGKKLIILAGVTCLIQAVVQMTFSALAIAQYFCIIDFMQDLPILIYMKILYFHNPSRYGNIINIGHAIEGIANQAFVLIPNEPFTSTRTFIINCTSLALSFVWAIASCILLAGGARNEFSRPTRWPWVAVTVAVCALDLVAVVIFSNDSFHTRTLNDIMKYIGGTASGISGSTLNTSATAWIMVVIYSRFIILYVLNTVMIVLVALNKNISNKADNSIETAMTSLRVSPTPPPMPPIQPTVTLPSKRHINTSMSEVLEPTAASLHKAIRFAESKRIGSADVSDTVKSFSNNTEPEVGDLNETRGKGMWHKIPRAGFSYTFHNRKKIIRDEDSPVSSKDNSIIEEADQTPETSPRLQLGNFPARVFTNKRKVNFPENLLSLPQRMENLIAEQQERLDRSVIGTAAANFKNGRPEAAAEGKSQMPWSYFPASTYRMRDFLPPDEDLPPVPLPDYTALGVQYRKASVHRAPLNLSSINKKKHYGNLLQANSSMLPKQVDVLY